MGAYRRIRNLIERKRLERELDRELSFHIAERIDDLVAEGMTPDEARRHAMRRFGNFGLQKERTLDMDISRWLESVAHDAAYGLRMITKNRVFSLIVVLSLGLGIAANSTLFSFVYSVLFRPLPLDHANELVERRTNEIGVRMALGARRRDVVHLIMNQTMLLVFGGIILGFAASFAAATALLTMPFLFRVTPNDPAAVLVAIGTMLGVACVAAYLPARRASRVDPSIALRCEK